MFSLNFKRFMRCVLIFVLALSMAFPVNAATVSYENGVLSAIFSEETEDWSKPSDSNGEEDWEDWSDWTDEDFTVSSNVKLSTEFTPEKVAENGNFTFWYDTTGADIYLCDKRSGVIWSNAVDDSYYSNEKADKAKLTQLLTVNIADDAGAVSAFDLCDAVGNADRFTLKSLYENNAMILSVEVQGFGISFEVYFSLDEQGITVSVPADRIVQNGENRIFSIVVMPYFGAASTSEEGYLLIPDGCGAIIPFEDSAAKEERVYSYQLYGNAEQDMNALIERDEQDIKNMMLPVYGICRENSGVLAAVSEGAENAVLNVVPNGYQCTNLARAYFTLNYIYTESLMLNGKTINQIMPTQELSDRSIKYFILESDACEYSDMAAVYKKYLEDTGVLKDKIDSSKVTVSLDVLMGVNKSGLFTDKLVEMTTFEELKDIVNDLNSAGVNLELVLQGWNTGGFTCLPTPAKTASALGGKSKLLDFTKWADNKDITVYLYNNFLEGETDSDSINLKKDAVRDYIGNIVSDERQSTVMLNMYATLENNIASARKAGLYKNSGFSLARVGQWLWNSYYKGNQCTRTQAMEACMTSLKSAFEQDGTLQVYGGNQYVLPYADSLREIPDRPSGYYYATTAVPFYQMVVSGYVRYTSIAGNMSYDLDYQKLKWIEYGCSPYYVITEENAINLVESDYDKLFSSEYSVWKDTIKSVYKEFSDRLSVIAGAQMSGHEYVTDALVHVEYDNGVSIYINYGDDPVQVDGISVSAKDYITVSDAKGGMAE